MNTIALPAQQFEIKLEENAVLSDIKKALMMIKGIASVRVISQSKATRLNATTIKAIEEVKAGKTYKASSVDDLLNQCLA
ncbi:MAG: hypothetical protein KBT34_07505 [Prevotella sp.]|nr:hypothetical protein [Candidatus Prevotella equi]